MPSTEQDRYALPGQGPTDEDLRQDVELTRQELGDTLAALVSVMDVKTRAREKLRQVSETVREHPIVSSGLAVAVVALLVLWGRQN